VLRRMGKPILLSRAVNHSSRGFVKYGWWTATYVSNERPIVLGGCSRSGTTLLRRLLNAHPEIYIGPETAVFQGNRNLEHLMHVTGLTRPTLRQLFRRSCCLAEFGEAVLKHLAQEEKKSMWGEKTPANVRCIEELFRFFPRARFIHIYRDGRDVVCSLRTHPKYAWRNGREEKTGIINPWEQCVDEWARDVQRGLAAKSDWRCFQIKYEELVNSPRSVVGSLLQWLGSDWSDSVLTEYRMENQLNHRGLAGPICASSVGRWKTGLPADARQMMVNRCGDLLATLGYTDGDDWVNG
jgi:protein-tyrosine sulfotransferase